MYLTNKHWLQHYGDELKETLDYEDIPLHQFLVRTTQKHGNVIAMDFLGKKLTYDEFYLSAKKCASQLQKLGVEKGDRVAIMLANCPQAMISYYGALMAGAIVVQTNPLYVERELAHQLTDSHAKVIICLDMVYPTVAKVRANTSLEHVIVTGIKDYLPFPKNLLFPLIQRKNKQPIVRLQFDSTTHSFSKWLEEGDEEPSAVDINPKEDLALLQYTGGTTGLPKGVMLTHRNLTVNTQQCKHWIYKTEDGNERMLAVLPFFHVYGMTVVMNLAVLSGFTCILLPKFDVKSVLKSIDKHKISLFPGAPPMYRALIHDPTREKYNLSSIKACISGAAALPLDTQETFEHVTGGKLVEGYGLTETSPVALANLIWGERKNGSIGLPWPDTEVVILSEEGEQLDIGEIGEVAIKGPQVMKGYWKKEEETARVFVGEWFLTGDMGYMDEDGFFYIVDRKKDMIIASGLNIYPREIEEVLFEHDSISDVAVIGIADEYRGETVKAFIVLKEGEQLSEDELDRYCRKYLSSYKVPKVYEFRKELPKTLIGKVLRRVLIEEEKRKAGL
ncbi:long-chain-fatty-acid--CoA ligase [Alkalihalobacillus trypoxylicola]|uniref:Long-chain fatty acid--CoA ligase n=1 Tax=Alkalihalobacillus trypoxylicola TaxID=519424 RepID=A0A162EBR5_9BACI|nr:long-chain-fatty-acid--CoA ligase [Alkalihalobacillus trypoxylicola]KYG32236.1 long-chain fatty acid--CoA ligase [Alkalihalobacillus trypoxylicola]